MKKNISSVLLAVVVGVVYFLVKGGLGGGPAVKYNNKLIESQSKVINQMISLSKTFQKKNPVVMSMGLKKLQNTIDDVIKDVEAMPDYEGNIDLRDAILDLLDFYKDIAAEEYEEMIEILGRQGEITQSDVDYLQTMQKNITEREDELDRELESAQSEFAKKHNIKIEKNKLQDKINNM
jgi:hypothetical protein